MQISLEVLLTFILTPVLTATATLFTLYARTQEARLKDRDGIIAEQRERIRTFDQEILPALASNERALKQLSDLYELMLEEETRHLDKRRRKGLGEK